VQGAGALKIGEGPVRTGVTAVLPRKDIWFTLSSDGEITGTNGNRVHALPYDRLAAAMVKHGRK